MNIAIIPARYASTRLPAKPLLNRTGKPLVVHVAEQASQASGIDRVIIATDDERIEQAVRPYGFECMMTRVEHPNGTSRLAEVAANLDTKGNVLINVQGDEPQIDPQVIDATLSCLSQSDARMATVASPFGEAEDPNDPNVVKVVLDQAGYAIYFSRALIPLHRDAATGEARPRYLKHLGLYAYQQDFVTTYAALSQTPAEQAEKLEQLRAIEHGHRIAVTIAAVHHQGIDTPEQYERFVTDYLAANP